MAGVGPLDVIEVAGCDNPWILDGQAVEDALGKIKGTTNNSKRRGKSKNRNKNNPLLLAVVLITGKTETGYIDKIKDIADALEKYLHPEWKIVFSKWTQIQEQVKIFAKEHLDKNYRYYGKDEYERLIESCTSAQANNRH